MACTLSTESETTLPKRPKLAPDRLSELPDLALSHILSHLFIHEAARTSILSKRFYSLWNSISILNFSDKNSGKYGELFVSFVDTALSFHRRREIDKFRVKFRYDFIYKNCVDEWISFALEKKVKCLCLNFTKPIFDRLQIAAVYHVLPKSIYDNGNLVELVICRCKFSTEALINWRSLKLLSISRTKLDEKLISKVLCGCPVLETLELKDWTGFDKLKIHSDSLRVLKIVGEQCPKYIIRPQDDIFLEISGPNLVSLEVSGSLYRTKLRVSDVGCLINATMDFEIRPPARGAKLSWLVLRDQDIVREILESLCFVKTLAVGGWCIKALSSCEAYNLSSSWSERRSLILRIPVIKWDHLGIASVLRSSPYLETLAIRLSYCPDMCAVIHGSYNDCDEEYYWKSWSTISKCPLLHLKKVKVIGFRESCRSMKPLFQFLAFLLRTSTVLEEITIKASKYVTQGTINEAMKLLAVPTASPDVVVQFDPPHFWVDTRCMYQKSDPLQPTLT